MKTYQNLPDFKRWTLDVFGRPASRAEILEYLWLRNLCIIAERNNWPHDLLNSMMPSNQKTTHGN